MFSPCFFSNFICFEPTYEELKLEAEVDKVKLGKSFEPTYEELKQGHLSLIGEGKKRFEPTYEELKPQIFVFTVYRMVMF